MDEAAFATMSREFSILPTLIEADELGLAFRATASARSTTERLTFRDLIECLTRLALTVYRHNPRLYTTEQKLSSLFRAMQLDQKDIILHRLRKSTQPVAGMGLTHHDISGLISIKRLCASICSR